MDEELLALKWINHHKVFLDFLSSARKKNIHTDVTLACEGEVFPAHKLILSTCSNYFSEIFSVNKGQNVIVVLKDFKKTNLVKILEYIYHGEMRVHKSELESLLEDAKTLEIKGLIIPGEDETLKNLVPSVEIHEKTEDNRIHKEREPNRTKRKKKDNEEEILDNLESVKNGMSVKIKPTKTKKPSPKKIKSEIQEQENMNMLDDNFQTSDSSISTECIKWELEDPCKTWSRAIWMMNGTEVEDTIPTSWIDLDSMTIKLPNSNLNDIVTIQDFPNEDWPSFELLEVKITSEIYSECLSYTEDHFMDVSTSTPEKKKTEKIKYSFCVAYQLQTKNVTFKQWKIDAIKLAIRRAFNINHEMSLQYIPYGTNEDQMMDLNEEQLKIMDHTVTYNVRVLDLRQRFDENFDGHDILSFFSEHLNEVPDRFNECTEFPEVFKFPFVGLKLDILKKKMTGEPLNFNDVTHIVKHIFSFTTESYQLLYPKSKDYTQMANEIWTQFPNVLTLENQTKEQQIKYWKTRLMRKWQNFRARTCNSSTSSMLELKESQSISGAASELAATSS